MSCLGGVTGARATVRCKPQTWPLVRSIPASVQQGERAVGRRGPAGPVLCSARGVAVRAKQSPERTNRQESSC